MHALRTASVLAVAAATLTGGLALAAEAPKTTNTSKTLFMAQEGCGTTAEAGRLETKPQADGADGCGTIGGVPINEILGSDGVDYTSTSSMKAFKLDGKKKVTGQVAAGSWFGAGGVGTVEWDVHVTAVTTTGAGIDFGTTTVSADVAGPDEFVVAPFSLAVPATANGKTVKTVSVNVVQRGANVGMSAYKLSGESYVVLPARLK